VELLANPTSYPVSTGAVYLASKAAEA